MLDKSGSCALVMLIINNLLYAINLGDSRALYSYDTGKYLYQISRDHKPNDEVEKNRIESVGGHVYYANKVKKHGKEGELYYDSFINLTTIHMPVCITNGIFLKKNKNEKIMFVLDNTSEEESVMSGNVSICANIFGEISYMQMNTEAMVGLEDIEELIGSMEGNVLYIHDIIHASLNISRNFLR